MLVFQTLTAMYKYSSSRQLDEQETPLPAETRGPSQA